MSVPALGNEKYKTGGMQLKKKKEKNDRGWNQINQALKEWQWKTFAPSVHGPPYTLSVKTDDQNRICSFYPAQKNPYIKTT